jgi:phospholipase/carboxylesterase
MNEGRVHATSVADVTFRAHPPENDAHPPVILLHGRTGDESSMWVLTRAFPSQGLVVAARGIFDAGGDDGFAWTAAQVAGRGRWEDFDLSMTAISEFADQIGREHSLDREEFVLMGFSQGAALAFAVARTGFRPAGVVALAAYLPDGDLHGLQSVPVYWGHGSKDDLVPIQQAREHREKLIQGRVDVTYCEAEVGHKVGVECMREVDNWFREYILADRGD